MTTNSSHDARTLNSLLRGELAATETYQRAFSKASTHTMASELHRLRDDHRELANHLRELVHERGGKPDQGSGVWGAFSKIVAGLANVFGHKASLMALHKGEESGKNAYENALRDDALADSLKKTIRDTFLPRTEAHIHDLKALLK